MASRAIETSDAASVAALIRAAFGAIPALDPPPSALRETEASVLAHLATAGGGAVVMQAELVAAVLWS